MPCLYAVNSFLNRYPTTCYTWQQPKECTLANHVRGTGRWHLRCVSPPLGRPWWGGARWRDRGWALASHPVRSCFCHYGCVLRDRSLAFWRPSVPVSKMESVITSHWNCEEGVSDIPCRRLVAQARHVANSLNQSRQIWFMKASVPSFCCFILVVSCLCPLLAVWLGTCHVTLRIFNFSVWEETVLWSLTYLIVDLCLPARFCQISVKSDFPERRALTKSLRAGTDMQRTWLPALIPLKASGWESVRVWQLTACDSQGGPSQEPGPWWS